MGTQFELKKKIKREVYKVWGNNPLIHFQQKSPFSFQIQYASERTLWSIKREYGTFEPWVIIITPLAYSFPLFFFNLHWHSCWVFQSFLRIRNVHVLWFISWVERYTYTVNWATPLWCLRLFLAPADCLQFCQGLREHKRRSFLDFGLYYSMDRNTCLKGNETLEV